MEGVGRAVAPRRTAVFARFKTGIPAIDQGLTFAPEYMRVSRFRPITVAVDQVYGASR
jgi:hypothetical protein